MDFEGINYTDFNGVEQIEISGTDVFECIKYPHNICLNGNDKDGFVMTNLASIKGEIKHIVNFDSLGVTSIWLKEE